MICPYADEVGSFHCDIKQERSPTDLLDASLALRSALNWEVELAEAVILALDAVWSDERHQIKSYKTRSGRDLRLALATTVGEAALDWEIVHQEWLYPDADYKSWRADELGFAVDLNGCSLGLTWRWKDYPDKPSNNLRNEQMGFTLGPSSDTQAGEISLEIKNSTYPHSSIKDSATTTLTLEDSIKVDFGDLDFTLNGTVDIGLVSYRNAPGKDTLRQGGELDTEFTLGPIQATLGLNSKRATSAMKLESGTKWDLKLANGDWSYSEIRERRSVGYPDKPTKDKLTERQRRKITLEYRGLDISGELTHENISYLHNTSKDYRNRIYQVRCTLRDIIIELSLKITDYFNSSSKNRRIYRAGLEITRELFANLELILELKLTQELYPNAGNKDRFSTAWAVELQLGR